MARYWSYLRYSTPEQQFGDSERRQEEAGRKIAETLGLEYVDEYRDLGVSAFRGKNRTNGALGRFLADVKAGRIARGDRLGVENIDRLCRQETIDGLKLMMQFDDAGIIPVIKGKEITREYLREHPYFWYELIGEMNRANSESQNKSERLIATNHIKREKARAGHLLFAGKRCPAWLTPSPDNTTYEIVPGREAIIRQIFEWAAGGLGAPTIAARLNENGIASFDKRYRLTKQGGWFPGYIHSILSGQAVRGFYQPHRLADGKRIPDGDPIECYPRIIDDALYYCVRQATKARFMHGRGRKGAAYTNIISGLGRCPACGAGLVLDTKNDHLSYLRCSKSRRRLCDNKAAFSYRRAEGWVLAIPSVEMSNILASLIPQARSENPMLVLENAIATKEAQIGALFEKFASNSNATIRAGAEKQIERLGAEIEAAKADLKVAKLESLGVEFYHANGFAERIAAARALLGSNDPQTIYDARARLAQELRQRIDVVLLNEDRSMVVRLNMGRRNSLAALEYSFSADRMLGVRAILRDGSTLARFEGGSFDETKAEFAGIGFGKIAVKAA